MKYRAVPLIGVLLASAAAAQTVPASSPAASGKDNAVVLSPFSVSTDRDTGFAAASSLAGGRLATDLRDTPAAYSVMTRDFIDALEIPDLDKAAEWITGNGGAVIDSGENFFFANPGAYVTRGYVSTGGTNGAAKPMRNFFTAFISPDSYAVERYEFGRGANSILFGNGTLGGIPTTSTKQARLDRAFTSVKMSVGSFANLRGELDVNTPLGDAGAVRFSALRQDSRGYRDRDFDDRRGYYLTMTLVPARNTEVRFIGESYDIARQVSFSNIQDRFSGWDGLTTFAAAQGAATLPTDAGARGVNRQGANFYAYDPANPLRTIFNYANDPITRSSGDTTTTPAGRFLQGNAASFDIANMPILYQIHAPPGQFDRAIANSAYRPIGKRFSVAADAPILTQRFRDIGLIISHRIPTQRWGGFYFEAGANTNTTLFLGNGQSNRQLGNVFIDINRVLPNGAPNPNFLVPYSNGLVIHNNFDFSYRNYRAAAAWLLPQNRFGRFSVNLNGGNFVARRDQHYRFLSVAQGDDHRQWGRNSLQALRVRYYWNSPGRPLIDDIGPVSFHDAAAGVSKTIQPRWVRDTSREDTQQVDSQDYDYLVAALNAKLLQDRLVILGGLRRDAYVNRVLRTIHSGDYPLDWDGVTRIMRPDAPADWASLSYTPLNANGTPSGSARPAANRPRISATDAPDPLYNNVRFQDDYNLPVQRGSKVTKTYGTVAHVTSWLSPFYNYAETFNPPDGSAVRIDGSPRASTTTYGKDYGLRLELFRGRLNIGLTRYEARESNAVLGSGVEFNNLYNANAVGDQSATGRNIRGIANLPQVFRDSYTKVARGDEFELVLNVSRQLRLMANYSEPRIGASDRYPDTLAYINTNMALFKQIATDAGAAIDANNLARVDTAIPVNQRSPDVQAAVDTFNQIITFQRTWNGASSDINDSPANGNLFGDYTFGEGRLKGLRVGAGVNWRGKRAIGNRGADTMANPAYNPALPVSASNPLAVDNPAVGPADTVWAAARTTVTATTSYRWKWRSRDFQANLVINNLLNDQSIIYTGTSLRPKGGDYTSPAREAVPGGSGLAFTTPLNFRLSLSVKM